MNRIVTAVLTVLLAISATFAIRGYWESGQRDLEIAALKNELADTRKRALDAEALARAAESGEATARADIERLKKERDEAKKIAKAAGATTATPGAAAEPPAAAGTGEAGTGNPMAGLAKMFQTEEGKKMMRSQTQMMVRMTHGDLGRALKLSAQDTDQVLSLLADRQTAISEATFAAMESGGFDEAGMKAAEEKTRAINEEYDAKLKAILGEDGLAQMKDYEKGAGDRMMMMQYEQHFSTAGVPLQAQQKDQLLSIMAAERKKTPDAPFDQSGRDPFKGFDRLDDASIDNWIAQEQGYHQRVLNAATSTLSPDQINVLQQAFSQTLDMQKFGIKMGREMIKGGKKGDFVVPAPVIVAPN